MDLRGVFPPLTTPFAADGTVSVGPLAENVAKYNRTSVSGYVATGSTGESVLLGTDEIDRIWTTVREAAASDKILIAGTGAESTAETIERTNRAAALGYHAALVKTPHYFKPQMMEDALAAHFLRVADAARIPVLIYSVPQFTGIAAEASLVARLVGHPNIIGMKESSGDVRRVTEIIHGAPENFRTLVGSASTFYASLAVGATGGILALACLLPELCVELYEAACAGEAARARVLQHQLLDSSDVIVGRLGAAGIKYAMDQLGYYGGLPRPPLLPLSDAQRLEVDRALAAVASRAPGR